MAVDLNTASETELAAIEGVGPEQARYIIQYRPFRSWEDVKKVPGLSETLVQKLHQAATIGEERPAAT